MYGYLLLFFIALIVLTQWITKHVQGVGYLLTGDGQMAMILYFVLIMPGVILHEMSHALTAWLLRVRVRHLSIGIKHQTGSKRVALGSVDIARTDPLRASLIGLAPMLVGCAAILWISSRALDVDVLGPFGAVDIRQEIAGILRVPDVGIWIYVVFAVGNAMLPSSSDRRDWGPALLLAAFVGALVYFSGLFELLSGSLTAWMVTGVNRLTHAFAIIVAIDLAFAATLFVFEQALAIFGFGRLRYR